MSAPSKLDVPFATGVVGSLPRPKSVQDLLPAFPGEESARAARTPQMDAAVRYAIAMQETAGLDMVSDGEWRRQAYTHIIADITGSFARGYVNRCVNDIRRRPSQPLIQWRFHPHTVHRDRRLRSTQGPSDA